MAQEFRTLLDSWSWIHEKAADGGFPSTVASSLTCLVLLNHSACTCLPWHPGSRTSSQGLGFLWRDDFMAVGPFTQLLRILERGHSRQSFSWPSLRSSRHHFCCPLLVQQTIKTASIQGEENPTPFLNRRSSKEGIATLNLSHPPSLPFLPCGTWGELNEGQDRQHLAQ